MHWDVCVACMHAWGCKLITQVHSYLSKSSSTRSTQLPVIILHSKLNLNKSTHPLAESILKVPLVKLHILQSGPYQNNIYIYLILITDAMMCKHPNVGKSGTDFNYCIIQNAGFIFSSKSKRISGL